MKVVVVVLVEEVDVEVRCCQYKRPSRNSKKIGAAPFFFALPVRAVLPPLLAL